MKKVQDQRSKVSHQHKFLEKSLSGYDKLAKKEKKLFLSGLFDGEGSFGFWSKGKNKSRSLQVKVETTDADMISRFHEMWGGNFFAIDRKKLNHKSLFRWQLTGDKAWNCLQEMIPYMCKRRRRNTMAWLNLLGMAVKTGAHIYKNKQDTKRLMSDASKLHAQKMAAGEIEYQTLIKTDQQQSWKDEFVLLLVSAPVLLLIWSVFSDDPQIKEKIDLFFEYFKNMPMWFQILFISVVGAVYGIKGTEIMKKR